jgi:predicted enzyme related to lactoylglutathione lyase
MLREREASMANSVCHFLVYADDLERAQTFYRAVFDWRFEPWGPPDFFQIFTGPGGDPGVTEGLLYRRDAPPGPGVNGYRCGLSVADIEATLAAIERHGGAMRTEIVELPGIGRVAEFADTEGNIVSIAQYLPGDARAVRA